MKNILNNKSGVTYVEFLIYFAIAGVIGLLLAVSITTSSRLFSDQRTTTHVSVQNRLALDEMTNQIRTATAVVDCTVTLCDFDTASSNTKLVLEIWPIDNSGNPYDPVDSTSDFIIYKGIR